MFPRNLELCDGVCGLVSSQVVENGVEWARLENVFVWEIGIG